MLDKIQSKIPNFSSNIYKFALSAVQESHAEGEQLRSALQDKKEKVEGFREVNLVSVREEVLREKKEMEKRMRELMMEQEKARQSKEKAEKKRKEVEEWWRIKVEEMKTEQELKLQALLTEIQILKEREEETEKEWRSRMAEVRKEVEENQAEFSISCSRAEGTPDMLDDHEIKISLQAGERTRQQEMDQQKRGRDDKEKGGGEVSRRGPFSFSKKTTVEMEVNS